MVTTWVAVCLKVRNGETRDSSGVVEKTEGHHKPVCAGNQ